MDKLFTKGQRVIVFCPWDGKGTVWAREAIVGSCGPRWLHLLRLDGTPFGDRFYMDNTEPYEFHANYVIRPVECVDDIRGCAEALARKWNAGYLEQWERCLARYRDHAAYAAYAKSIQGDIAALHEPRLRLNENGIVAL